MKASGSPAKRKGCPTSQESSPQAARGGAPRTAHLSEQKLTRSIIDSVNRSGLAYVWRNQSGRIKVRGGWCQLSPEGTPDIVGYTLRGYRLGAGYFVGFEVKLGNGRVRPLQANFLAFAHVVTGLVRSEAEAIGYLSEDIQL